MNSSPDIPDSGGSNGHSPVEILIVEDSATQAEMLKDILEEAGYRVSVASNGVKAFKHLSEEGKPAVTVSDVNMPEINGYELCRLIKATPNLNGLA